MSTPPKPPNSGLRLSKSLPVLLLAGLALTWIAGPRAPRIVDAADGAGFVVRLSPSAAAALRSDEVLRGADYGGFAWYELTSAGLARLERAGMDFERVPDGTRLQINGYHFDPLVDAPVVPLELRAPTPSAGPGLWLVQLIGPTGNGWLEALSRRGAQPVQYYAENSYLVWSDAARAEALTSAPYVRWVGPYHAAYRLAPELLTATGVVDVSVLAYAPQLEAVVAGVNGVDGSVLARDEAVDESQYLSIRVEAGRLVDLARLAPVIAVTPGGRDPVEMDEMGDKISAGMVSGSQPQPKPPSYKGGFLTPHSVDGTGVVVHVNDSGVYEQHDDLDGRMEGEYGNKAGSHGTHVAGIILGEGYNNIGDTSSGGSWIYGLGVAPNAEYVDEWFTCAPATCGRHAETNGANVSNNSWGYGSSSGPNYGAGYTMNARTWDGVVQDANTNKSGAQLLTIVSAAGNGGPSAQKIIEPWEAKNVISVAATRNWRSSNGNQGSGSINTVASFSSRGNCRDGRNCPVVAAPGRYVISSRYLTTGCGSQPAPNSSNHSVCSGTSMASPHVAGVAALITEWWRDNNSNNTPGPAMIKALIVNGAKDMSTANIPNTSEGWGRVNVWDSIDPPVATLRWDRPQLFHSSGETWSKSITAVNTSKPLKVTLVWTDAKGAGNGGTTAAWVNNLNLKVDLGTATWWGNNFSNGWSNSSGLADAKNNTENVYIQSPNSGVYTVNVIAANIAGDGVLHNGDTTDSNFALVCQNCSLFTGTVTPTWTPGGPTATPTFTPTPRGDVPITDTPTPTATGPGGLENTATPTPTWTTTPSVEPTETLAATATASPTPTAPPTATNTPLPTATHTPVPTTTPLPTATATPLPTSTPTGTWTPSSTPSPTPTETSTPTDTPVPTQTDTPQPTSTDTPAPTATNTPSPTWTPVPTATNTPVPTATNTPVPTATNTPVPTATDTVVPTATDTPPPTATQTPPPKPTDTPVPTATPTPTPSAREGDCNQDGLENAADVAALILEVFDGDGLEAASAPGGTFAGSPTGCDANADGQINAADMACTILLIFNGPGVLRIVCGGTRRP